MSTRDDRELRRAVRRLALEFTALIAVLFLLVGTLLVALVSNSATESLDRTLSDSARVDSPHDLPAGVWVTIVDTDGDPTVASPELPDGLPDTTALTRVARTGDPIRSTVNTDGRSYRVLTTTEHGRIVQVAVSRAESQEELSRLLWALIASGIAALLIGALAAVWMARRAIRPLSDALALQRRFVADASHELRTPLTLLSTRAQLLRRRLPDHDEAFSDGLDEIVQDARDLTDTLEDLLIASDPRESDVDVGLDVSASAREAVFSFATQAEARGITLTGPDASVPVIVTASPAAIRRLFAALIANALDHARSVIAVDVRAAHRSAFIVVRDDGPGFPTGAGSLAFERFASARDDSGTRRGHRHYGLGLALVADVATRYGGTIKILDGTPGAAVQVQLPLR